MEDENINFEEASTSEDKLSIYWRRICIGIGCFLLSVIIYFDVIRLALGEIKLSDGAGKTRMGNFILHYLQQQAGQSWIFMVAIPLGLYFIVIALKDYYKK